MRTSSKLTPSYLCPPNSKALPVISNLLSLFALNFQTNTHNKTSECYVETQVICTESKQSTNRAKRKSTLKFMWSTYLEFESSYPRISTWTRILQTRTQTTSVFNIILHIFNKIPLGHVSILNTDRVQASPLRACLNA